MTISNKYGSCKVASRVAERLGILGKKKKLVPSPPAKMNTPPPSPAKHSDIGKMDIEPPPQGTISHEN